MHATLGIAALSTMMLFGATVFGQTNTPQRDGPKQKKWIPGQGWVWVSVSPDTEANAGKPYPIIEGKWKETGTGVMLVIERNNTATGKFTCRMLLGVSGPITGTVSQDGDIEFDSGMKAKISDDGTNIAGTRTKDGKQEKFVWIRVEDKRAVTTTGPAGTKARKKSMP